MHEYVYNLYSLYAHMCLRFILGYKSVALVESPPNSFKEKCS